MIEYLTCQTCGKYWSREVKRGRKPSQCNSCKMWGYRPVVDPFVAPRPKPINRTLVLTDGGMKAAGFRETNDCTVRALATATGVSYLEAHTFMRENGRKPRKGAYFKEILYRHGGKALGHTFVDMPLIRRRGLKAALLWNPPLRTGTWIIKMRAHVATLKDGKLVDSFDSSRKDILHAWKVSPLVGE